MVWLSLCYGYNLPLWNNLELENFKDKINEVTSVMAAVYSGDHKFFELIFGPEEAHGVPGVHEGGGRAHPP